MMMIPRRSNDFDLLGDIFTDPFFNEHESKIMKTDIKEKDNEYQIEVELPGYQKDNIKMNIEDGYLTIQAEVNSDTEEKEDGKFVRKERYIGSCSRSFYVGDEIKSEDIKASFKDGMLKITIPKIEKNKELPEKQYIQIEG